MKFLVFALVSMMTVASHAAPLSSAEIDQKCLEVLVNNASKLGVEGDVHPTETLAGILADGMNGKPRANAKKEITNECIKVTRDSIYECTLFISTKINGASVGETGISYEVNIGKDGETPVSMLVSKVYVSRGH
jgi:hypothetical protein